MKFLIVLFLTFTLFLTSANANYSTPGSGINWNLNDLVTNSGGSVTQQTGFYQINDTVTISSSDTLYITTDETVKFAAGTFLAVSGVLIVNPPAGVTFTALDTNQRFLGVRVDLSNSTVLRKLTFEYGNSLRIFDCSIIIDSCVFRYNTQSTTWGNAAISVFQSSPVITNSQFLYNIRAAIQGGSNIANAPQIIGNYFFGNNTANANVPQINLGATGTDTARIINNQIMRASTNSGGLGFLPIGTVNAVITGNLIINNRYGMVFNGGSNINALIANNQIDSNNTQGLPLLGGSGINFLGGSAGSHQNSIVTGNVIRWNLWGITIQNRARPKLGNINSPDTLDKGHNWFYANGNSGELYDLYNNTPDSIYAQNNYWGTDDVDSVEMRIFHSPDDPALGFVNYIPILTNPPTGIQTDPVVFTPDEFVLFQNYPNPFNPATVINFQLPTSSYVTLKIFDITGREVTTLANEIRTAGSHSVLFDASGFSSGVYFYRLEAGSFISVKRMLFLK